MKCRGNTISFCNISQQCHRHCNGKPRQATPPNWPACLLAVVAAVATSARGVFGFASEHIRPNYVQLQPGCNGRTSKLKRPSHIIIQLSTKEEAAAPLSFDPSPSSSATASDVLSNPSSFITQKEDAAATPAKNGDDISQLIKTASGAAAFLLLLSSTTLPSTIVSAYSTLLIEHPLPTKSLTSGVLCGVSDTVAQFRDSTRKEFNLGRLIRFAGKGCVGGIIWSFWYDNLDRFLNLDSQFNIYQLSGINGGDNSIINYNWIREHLAIVTTTLSITIEQFFWCPIVFGTFEIPVSTLLNGGSVSTVRKEVDSKLNGLLISNAKIWTLANVVIYNAPVEWRPAVSNCVDLLWQSIVSDVAADCGKVEDDICEVADVVATKSQSMYEKDYSFYAEKSRL